MKNIIVLEKSNFVTNCENANVEWLQIYFAVLLEVNTLYQRYIYICECIAGVYRRPIAIFRLFCETYTIFRLCEIVH